MIKKSVLISGLIIFITTLSVAKGHNGEDRDSSSMSMERELKGVAVADIGDEQKEKILFMLEEQKLAKDIYSYLNELWGNRAFKYVSKSEEKHIDFLKTLADKYNIEIPISLDIRGEFKNEELQMQYNSYLERGKVSTVDALEIGVAIEERDISELETILDSESELPTDIKNVYSNLLKGSYNHLKAFNRQLGR